MLWQPFKLYFFAGESSGLCHGPSSLLVLIHGSLPWIGQGQKLHGPHALQYCSCIPRILLPLSGSLQDGIRRRDAEITRLGAAGLAGCDVDALSLQYRSQAQEEMILQLNQQVGALWLVALPGTHQTLQV